MLAALIALSVILAVAGAAIVWFAVSKKLPEFPPKK